MWLAGSVWFANSGLAASDDNLSHRGLLVGSIGILTHIWQAAKLFSDERRRTLATIGMDAATLDLLSTLRRAGPPYRLSTRELAARLVTAGAVTQRASRAR
jgi:hypothetical protein